MPACAKTTASLYSVALLVTSSIGIRSVAQTSLDDVHVMSSQAAPAVESLVTSTQLLAGSYLHVIKRDVNLVLVPVSVTDPRQRLVTGLGRENFQVFEGKKPQEIRHFSSEDTPVSVRIILDISGSMKDKMERVREAVHQFCETANPQDEYFMITFADKPRLASDFTSVPEEIEKELVFTQPNGRTALLDAVYMGVEKMRQAKYGKKALLVISDGGDNHSRYGEREVRAAVKESDVMIYAVGTFDRFVPTQEERLGPALLSSITEPTGGRAFTLQNSNDLPAVAHRIGTELRTQYVIGYRPQDAPHDGKWHKISVKLRLPRKWASLQAHSKMGYYDHGQ